MALLFCVVQGVTAQQATTGATGIEQRVSLEETALALDGQGRTALAGQLLTKALAGLPDAPVRNARFIIENRSPFLYTYVTGSVTFYDERGVRCGEGLFTMSALTPAEQAETDAPGLRISCAPRSWRMIAHNLLVRSPGQSETAEQAEKPTEPAIATSPEVLPLQLVVDGKVYSAPLGSTLEIPVRKRRIKISVRPAP
ncbi:MAG: hypothetical protein QOJ64_1981 [Acidobacteriota bacterium]|jgi:hypothetical protein|nr:hypothetical protein [Acidobacteriota bacterium]